MNISLQKNDSITGLLKVEIETSDYAPAVDKALKTAQRKAQMPGFRSGMVPMGMIKKMYGKSALAEEINGLSNKHLMDYVKEKKLDLIGSPLPSESVDIEGSFDNPGRFVFHYDVAFAPEFTLSLDKSKRYTQKMIKVTEDVLKEEIDRLTKRYGSLTDVQRPETDEDVLFIDLYVSDADGNKIDEAYHRETILTLKGVSDEATKQALYLLERDATTRVNSRLLSSNETDLAQLLGVEKDNLDSVPETLILKVNKVQQIVKAELTEEFFAQHYPDGTVTSEEEMKASIRKQISGHYDNYSNQILYYAVQKDLIENTPIVLPVEFLKRWLPSVNESLTTEKVESEFQSYANGIKWELIENKIFSQFEINYTPDELDEAIRGNIRERFLQYGLPNVDDETVNKVLQQELKDQKAFKHHTERLLDKKVLDLVKKNCTIDLVEVAEADFFGEGQG